ncbi:MAG: hypothetical protein RR202_06205 [Bacteroidales bacterium]
MKLIARFFSSVLHPLLMPLYGTFILIHYSYLDVYPASVKRVILYIVGLFTLVIPLVGIVLLKALRLIEHVSLNRREDRKLPYLITLASYFACGYLLYKLNLPPWVVGFVAGGLLSLIVASIITIWWKISAHMTGMGGFLGAMVFLFHYMNLMPLWLLLTAILLTGLLGTSRIELNRHTFGQVLAGTFNGFVCVYLTMLLF